MDMEIGDRLALLSILPQKSSALKLKMARDVADKISPTDEEKEKYNVVEERGSIR